MSKASRERARQTRHAGFPKSVVIAGIIAVVAIAAVAVKSLVGGSGTASTVITSAPADAPSANTASTAHGKQLYFFMNPDGYPCQTQLGILNTVADSLSKVARVVYIKTTEPADLQKFEEFGIRGLPSLVIVDEAGRELSRFAPGIQSADAVLAALTR